MMNTRVNIKPTKKDLKTRNRIILLKAGIRDVTALAHKVGFSRPYTSNVLYGHVKSEAARRVIAAAIGKPESYIWPARRRRRAA